MDVAGDETPRGAAKTVGDSHHQAFLHRHHVSEVRMIPERMHDRQLGSAGIAEQMGDPLVLQQGKEGRAPADAILHFVSSFPRPLTLRDRGTRPNLKREGNGGRSWLPCAKTSPRWPGQAFTRLD